MRDRNVPRGTLTSEDSPKADELLADREESRDDHVRNSPPLWTNVMEAVRQTVKNMWVDKDVHAQNELEKADVVAHDAMADVNETSRELKEKTEETRAQTDEKPELEPKPDLEPFEAKPPPATVLVVRAYNEER